MSIKKDYCLFVRTDIVRDMREANKALDEAMITKVNAMVDEQNRQRTMEFEKLRVSHRPDKNRIVKIFSRSPEFMRYLALKKLTRRSEQLLRYEIFTVCNVEGHSQVIHRD